MLENEPQLGTDLSRRTLLQTAGLAALVGSGVGILADAASGTEAVDESTINLTSGAYGPFVGDGSLATGAADVGTINAALAAAETRGGAVVIPATARVVAAAPLHGNLITARRGVTLKSDGAVIKIADGSPTYNAVIGSSTNVSGFSLDGITIDQNKDNVAPASLNAFEYAFAVHLVDGTGLRLQNCRFLNADGINAVVMNGSSGTNGVVNVGDVFVTGCTFENVGTDLDHDHSSIYTVATSATITGNHFFGRAAAAKSAICAIEVHGSSHRINNNHIENFREAINATGIAHRTDGQIVSGNTILRCMRGIRAYSQALAGTVSPAIRSMILSGNAIDLDPDFWAPVHAVEPQGISYVSTSDLAIHGLIVQGNSIVIRPYTGSSAAVISLLAGGVTYSRTGGETNHDRAVSIINNTVIGALSCGIALVGLKVQGLLVSDNILQDCGNALLTLAEDHRAGVLLMGEAVGASINRNRVLDTRPGGGCARGVTWLLNAASVDGEIIDNPVRLVGAGREVHVNDNAGAPLVKHLVRSADSVQAVPTAAIAAGSEWTLQTTGVKTVQRKAPSGAVWVGPTSTTALRPAAADAGAGTGLFDTTLGRPIWSNGTVWKDATGTTV